MRNAEMNPARRKFLRAVPAAAATGFTLTDASVLASVGFAASAAAQSTSASARTFKLFKAQEIQDDIRPLRPIPATTIS